MLHRQLKPGRPGRMNAARQNPRPAGDAAPPSRAHRPTMHKHLVGPRLRPVTRQSLRRPVAAPPPVWPTGRTVCCASPTGCCTGGSPGCTCRSQARDWREPAAPQATPVAPPVAAPTAPAVPPAVVPRAAGAVPPAAAPGPVGVQDKSGRDKKEQDKKEKDKKERDKKDKDNKDGNADKDDDRKAPLANRFQPVPAATTRDGMSHLCLF